MQHQARHKFFQKILNTSDSSRMLRPILVVFALWAGAAPLLGLYDIWGLSINIGIGIIILSLGYTFTRMRKHSVDMQHLTLQEFIDTNKATCSITLHDLTNEQIENLRSGLRLLYNGTTIPIIEESYREHKSDSLVDSQANYRMAA